MEHYHVTMISPQLSLPPVIRYDEVEAIIEFDNMVELLAVKTGLEVIYKGETKALFFDGSSVRYFRCKMRNCVEV